MFAPSLDSLCPAQSIGLDASFTVGQSMPGGPEQGIRRIPVPPDVEAEDSESLHQYLANSLGIVLDS